MNTREELQKIVNWIDKTFETAQDQNNDYKSGAYAASLEIVKNDIEVLIHVLEFRANQERIAAINDALNL